MTASYNGHSGEKRDRVQRWLNERFAAGDLPRPARCVVCGQTRGALHAHHEDYDKPADFVALCITCHLLLHGRFRYRGVWDEYRARVAAGWQAPPLTQAAAMGALQRTIFGGKGPAGHQVRTAVRATYLDTLPGQLGLPMPPAGR